VNAFVNFLLKLYTQWHKNEDVFLVLDMQATFVTLAIVDLPTSNRNSQGTTNHSMGTQAKQSNVTKHMPTQFQL